MRDIFQVPDEITLCLGARIVRLAKFWAEHPKRPRPNRHVRRHWDKLMDDWAKDRSLPLYVRKTDRNRPDRGSIIRHKKSGRLLVPTDNSPPRWAFVLACKGAKPSIKQIKNMVRRDSIPVALTLGVKSGEERRARYKCTLQELEKDCPMLLHSEGWTVAHIDDVGLKTRRSLKEIELETLKEHFGRLMKPSNMFVVPKDYAGLADLAELCQQIKSTNSDA